MNPQVIYCLPVPALGGQFMPMAYRFVASWIEHQPLADCDLWVVMNGGQADSETELLFSSISSFKGFMQHNNEGMDIGAFKFAASVIPCDMMLFFGTNAYFKQSGWLKRMVDVFRDHGPQLYGAFASVVYRPHIRTTGFWCPPELLSKYPRPIVTHQDRYVMEHREGNFTDWVESVGRKELMVTWSGIYSRNYWGQVTNAYGNGDHSECLIRDKVSDMMCPVK